MMLMMKYAVADRYGTDYKIPVEKVNFKILQYHWWYHWWFAEVSSPYNLSAVFFNFCYI